MPSGSGRVRAGRAVRIVLAALLGVCLAQPAFAASNDRAKDQVVTKQVQGAVSAVNAHGIAVEVGRTATASQEMYLPFAENVQLSGVSRVTDLHDGDTVAVEYRELMPKATDQTVSTAPAIRRVATAVALVARAAPPAPEPAEGAHEPAH